MTNIIWSGGEPVGSKCVIGMGRDGIINEALDNYCYRPDDFKPIPNSLEAIAEARRKGYKLAIITEQGGIAKGKFTQDDVDKVHNRMFEMLGQAGCPSIDALYYSASSDKQDIYAKPNVGMFKRCEKENPHIKFKEGYYVGNCIKDLKAAVNIGAKPVLVRTGAGLDAEAELDKYTYRDLKRRTVVFDTLQDFINSLP